MRYYWYELTTSGDKTSHICVEQQQHPLTSCTGLGHLLDVAGTAQLSQLAEACGGLGRFQLCQALAAIPGESNQNVEIKLVYRCIQYYTMGIYDQMCMYIIYIQCVCVCDINMSMSLTRGK